MISIMELNNLFKKVLKGAAISALWLLIWQAAALIVNSQLLIPTPLETLKALFVLGQTGQFYLAVLYSLLRIIIGFVLGVAVGFIGGVIANKFSLFESFTRPALQVIKAVPVASFIILAFFWFQSKDLPIFIAFLMVLPMVWSTVQTSLSGIDEKYIEMARVYKLSPTKIFFKIKLPFIIPQFIATSMTALGFAWKSGIAAEVICRPQTALGTLLDQNKSYLDIPAVFALTFVVAILSIVLEFTLKRIVRRFTNAENK